MNIDPFYTNEERLKRLKEKNFLQYNENYNFKQLINRSIS